MKTLPNSMYRAAAEGRLSEETLQFWEDRAAFEQMTPSQLKIASAIAKEAGRSTLKRQAVGATGGSSADGTIYDNLKGDVPPKKKLRDAVQGSDDSASRGASKAASVDLDLLVRHGISTGGGVLGGAGLGAATGAIGAGKGKRLAGARAGAKRGAITGGLHGSAYVPGLVAHLRMRPRDIDLGILSHLLGHPVFGAGHAALSGYRAGKKAREEEPREGSTGSEKGAAAPTWRETATTAGAGALGLLGAHLGAKAISRGASALSSKVRRPGQIKKILAVNPTLAEAPKEQLDLAVNSLATFAPDLLKDPLAGSDALARILGSRDPTDGVMRITGANIAGSMNDALRPRPDYAGDNLSNMFQSAVSGAMADRASSVRSDEEAERRRKHDLEKLERGQKLREEYDLSDRKMNADSKRERMRQHLAYVYRQKAQGHPNP